MSEEPLGGQHQVENVHILLSPRAGCGARDTSAGDKGGSSAKWGDSIWSLKDGEKKALVE